MGGLNYLSITENRSMPTYIALLRGINVSGQKKIKMSELRELMMVWGFDDVQSYIQSGNLIFKYPGYESTIIQTKIKEGITQSYGYVVEVLVMERNEFLAIMENSPYRIDNTKDTKQIYFVFLMDIPDVDQTCRLRSEKYEGEEFTITERCIYLNCFKRYGKAKCNNNFFEKRLKVRATTRNYNTVKTLLKLSGEA